MTQPTSVYLITGAASGIGARLALKLAGSGVGLALHTRGNQSGLQTTADQASAKGATVLSLLGDLMAPTEASRVVENIAKTFGRLDGLVSNAGFPDRTGFDDLNPNDLTQSFEAMPGAFMRLMQASQSMLRASPCARVVAVSSFVAHRFYLEGDMFPASAIAKSGLESAVRVLATQFAGDAIPINAVVPGYIRKDREAGIDLDEVSATRLGTPHIPMRRIGEPEEVVAAIEFLLSPGASYITGQCLHIDGGMML
ncbi:MAG: SDR family oxidoreductase [Gammaproteobacteria bacterium]|nr:SDR family oxidoreductase [Gammaproteobacteria bacterium]